MRTATLFLSVAALSIFAAAQEPTKPAAPASQGQQKPRFEVSPATVSQGQPTQLSWSVEGATSVTIQPVVGSVPASGSVPVTPSETTTYTLTAAMPSGNVTVTATVTVGPPAAAAPATAPPTVEGEVKTPPAGAAPPAGEPAETAPKIPPPTGPKSDIDPGKLAAPRGTSTGAPAAPVDEHAFILGAEDQIEIQVYGSPEFSGAHMIRPDGKITLNFIGEVKASDQTPEQLGNAIKERIKKYVVDPDVAVKVIAVRSQKYFIQGEVGKTGEFPLVVPTRVLEALVNAGGFKDFANKKKIIIMRNSGTGNPERLNFNYADVIKGKHMEQNVFLRNGDIIIVK